MPGKNAKKIVGIFALPDGVVFFEAIMKRLAVFPLKIWRPGVIKFPIFLGDQTMQMHGTFEGFPL